MSGGSVWELWGIEMRGRNGVGVRGRKGRIVLGYRKCVRSVREECMSSIVYVCERIREWEWDWGAGLRSGDEVGG